MSTITQSFFNRSAQVVARELLGKYLVRELNDKRIAAMITETEAYVGPHDLASHASRGLTARNAPMFGPPARWYIYFVYGMHWMLNVVTGKNGYPAAVLIRSTDIAQGPARVTKQFFIDRAFNGKKVSPESRLWIEDRGVKIARKDIVRKPRIGVAYAGEKWSKAPYRFILKNDCL